jgi:ubiquinone/menaquinone biosynthesis C-methylase UbiE
VHRDYFGLQYGTQQRFVSYWHQISEILSVCREGDRVLEIGIGSGLVHWYLKNCGLCVTTLDIDGGLRPEVCGTVEQLPFQDHCFDLVAASEVLEHIPYQRAMACLMEFHRVARQHALLSVPDHTRVFRFMATIPKLGVVRFGVEVPVAVARNPRGEEHEWEIGIDRYSAKQLRRDIRAIGFDIAKNYRPFEHPSHRFLLLRKHPGIC